MITMRIKGGLGNQLFQYAAAYSLAHRLGQEFQFNPSFTGNMTPRGYRLPLLKLQNSAMVADDELPWRVRLIKGKYVNKTMRMLDVPKHKCGEYLYWLETRDKWQPEFFTIEAENLYVDGYFQSEDYFKNYRSDLLKQLCPNYSSELEWLHVLERIRTCEAVAVHVRHSDFVKDRNPYHYVLEEDYYMDALNYMRNKLQSPVFFWFSDDMEWVKKRLGVQEDFIFVELHTAYGDIDDLVLMKECKHIVAANSTFSWWAAWLNENRHPIRIVPKKPYGIDRMIPDGWIKL